MHAATHVTGDQLTAFGKGCTRLPYRSSLRTFLINTQASREQKQGGTQSTRSMGCETERAQGMAAVVLILLAATLAATPIIGYFKINRARTFHRSVNKMLTCLSNDCGGIEVIDYDGGILNHRIRTD